MEMRGLGLVVLVGGRKFRALRIVPRSAASANCAGSCQASGRTLGPGLEFLETGMKPISIPGVIIGGVADIVGTNVLAFPLMVAVMVPLAPSLHGASHAQITAAMTAAIHGSSALTVIQWIPGILGSLLGGYVAAWIARHDMLLNGALSAWLCILIGIYSLLHQSNAVPLYEHILLLVGSPVLGLFGGYLRFIQMRAAVATA